MSDKKFLLHLNAELENVDNVASGGPVDEENYNIMLHNVWNMQDEISKHLSK